MTRRAWSAEEDAQLAKLRQEGLSYAQIARRLSLTKGAVAGRLDRVFVASGSRLPRKRGTGGQSVAAQQTKHLNRTARRPYGITGSGFNGSAQLAGRGCLFPLWDMSRPTHAYCGAARRAASPYCAEHHAKCYIGFSR